MSARILTLLPPSRLALSAVAVVMSVALASSAWATSLPDGRAGGEIYISPAASGQYVVTALVNGTPVPAIVDTGASQVVLTYEDAVRAGVSLKPGDFTQVAATANGATRFAPIVLSVVAVGSLARQDVQALVAERGQLSSSLLGMTFLSKLSKVGTREGILVLSN